MLTHAPWAAVPGLRHGFLDRRTGVRPAGWELGADDGAGPTPVVTARQVHGVRVVTAAPTGERPEADGLVTATPGPLVGVVTADCVPVLLLDSSRRVAGAVHAGWRGATAGVLEAALTHLRVEFGSAPGDLEAVIGPAIGGCCYQVGPEVREAFEAHAPGTTAPAWEKRDGRHYVDLRTAARLLLLARGVPTASVVGQCTFCGDGYHSYRRDGAGTGRQLSFIGWR